MPPRLSARCCRYCLLGVIQKKGVSAHECASRPRLRSSSEGISWPLIVCRETRETGTAGARTQNSPRDRQETGVGCDECLGTSPRPALVLAEFMSPADHDPRRPGSFWVAHTWTLRLRAADALGRPFCRPRPSNRVLGPNSGPRWGVAWLPTMTGRRAGPDDRWQRLRRIAQSR